MKRAERAVATSLVPSADDATENQSNIGTLVGNQVKPELVEIIIGPGPLATATNLVPSAEEAIACQFPIGALVCVQDWARAGLGAVNRLAEVATANTESFVFIIFFQCLSR